MVWTMGRLPGGFTGYELDTWIHFIFVVCKATGKVEFNGQRDGRTGRRAVSPNKSKSDGFTWQNRYYQLHTECML